MKILPMQIGIGLSAGLLFLAVRSGADETNPAAAVHYTPPPNFHEALPLNSSDPGDDPLSTTGPDFLRYTDKDNDRCGEVIFCLAWAGVYAGEGKILRFLPTGPKELKEYLEVEYRRKFPTSSAVITKLAGSTAVSLTATRPPESGIAPYFLHFCWIQLATNAVLKVTAITCSPSTFTALTNSMSSIKMDKAELLKHFVRKPESDLPRGKR